MVKYSRSQCCSIVSWICSGCLRCQSEGRGYGGQSDDWDKPARGHAEERQAEELQPARSNTSGHWSRGEEQSIYKERCEGCVNIHPQRCVSPALHSLHYVPSVNAYASHCIYREKDVVIQPIMYSMFIYLNNSFIFIPPPHSELWFIWLWPPRSQPARLQREGSHLRGDADSAAHVPEREITNHAPSRPSSLSRPPLHEC